MKHPPRFVYLATFGTQTFIGDATNPWTRLAHRNRTNKKRKLELQMIIGPFFDEASRFKREWQRERDCLQHRVRAGCQYARKRRVCVYARDPDWIQGVLRRKSQV
jgi:hypothetical protein